MGVWFVFCRISTLICAPKAHSRVIVVSVTLVEKLIVLRDWDGLCWIEGFAGLESVTPCLALLLHVSPLPAGLNGCFLEDVTGALIGSGIEIRTANRVIDIARGISSWRPREEESN